MCFICNSKFKTHKQLKAHIQKKCKSSSSTSPSNAIVHRTNEDILPEDEHRCPKCPKITNNQVSLLNHMNPVHMTAKEKCDRCGQEFASREVLVKHIVDHHTQSGIQQQQGVHGHYQGELNSVQWLPRIKCQNCDYETNNQNEMNFHK